MASDNEEWTGVNLHEETAALVDEMSPEWMARSAFVDGVVWMFYGHLGHQTSGNQRRLTMPERSAIYRLKLSGVKLALIADAFDVTKKTVSDVQAKGGHGGSQTLRRREGE